MWRIRPLLYDSSLTVPYFTEYQHTFWQLTGGPMTTFGLDKASAIRIGAVTSVTVDEFSRSGLAKRCQPAAAVHATQTRPAGVTKDGLHSLGRSIHFGTGSAVENVWPAGRVDPRRL